MKRIPPVLLCIFNRPDLTEQSFRRVREVKPSQLFIAADGPRDSREGEAELCEAARSIIRKVDWPCEVHTLLRERNLGCRLAMIGGIDWFFEHVESGVILEDDCVAHPSFFQFCDAVLNRYEHDERVMCVTGNNFQRGIRRGDASYYFSMFPHCWGWATWRRAWKLYVDEMHALKSIQNDGLLASLVGVADAAWLNAFEQVKNGNMDAWDYRWFLSCWSQNGLTVTPNVNLVANIGFDTRATHTKATSALTAMRCEDIGEITHPEYVHRSCIADDFVLDNVFYRRPKNCSLFRRIGRKVRATLR